MEFLVRQFFCHQLHFTHSFCDLLVFFSTILLLSLFFLMLTLVALLPRPSNINLWKGEKQIACYITYISGLQFSYRITVNSRRHWFRIWAVAAPNLCIKKKKSQGRDLLLIWYYIQLYCNNNNYTILNKLELATWVLTSSLKLNLYYYRDI